MSSQTCLIVIDETNESLDIGPILQDAGGTNPGDPLTGLAFDDAGLTLRERRGGLGDVTTRALATQTVTGTHSDGGFVELDATNMPGMYRLDFFDATVASGEDRAILVLNGAADMSPHTNTDTFHADAEKGLLDIAEDEEQVGCLSGLKRTFSF